MERSSVFKLIKSDYGVVRGGRKKFLTSTLGLQIDEFVNINGNRIVVHSLSLKRDLFGFVFPNGSEIVDVDYFPEADGKFGLLVAINDEDVSFGFTSYIVGLVQDDDTALMKITSSLAIPHKIVVIKTLFNKDDMSTIDKRKELRLHSKIEKWSHVVAVGTKNAHCYICHLAPQLNADSIDINSERRNLVDFMVAFIRGGKFVFEGGMGHCLKFSASSVSVTSLGLLPRSRTLLVGLSMGGILSASLNPTNSIEPLEIRSDRMIRYLAPLEPEDDPDRHEYFLAATDGSPRHPIQIALYRGVFKYEGNDFSDHETRYDRPYFQCAFEHPIRYGTNWITMKTLTSRRSDGGLTNNRTRKESGDLLLDTSLSILNVSQAFGSSWIRSTVLFVYEKKGTVNNDLTMEASVFDIDSYYYKRMPSKAILDSTSLKQCPFISNISSNLLSKDVQDVAIIMDQREVSRFSSPICDADQLFYPSSITFNRTFVATPLNVSHMKICSLQETILEICANNLHSYLRASNMSTQHILAAGLVRDSVLRGSPNSSMISNHNVNIDGQLSAEQKVILTAMLYYGKVDAILKITKNAYVDDSLKREIVLWAFYESCDYRKMMLDRTLAIFSNAAVSLSPTANEALDLGVQLLQDVNDILVHFSKYLKDQAMLAKLGLAVKCSLIHTILVRNFIENQIVPLGGITRCAMREKHEAKKIAAIRNKTALPIQVSVRNLHRISPDEEFWDEMPHEQWYPPTPLNLLEIVLNVKISERVKREVTVQYVADWIRAEQRTQELSVEDVAKQVFSYLHDALLGVSKENVTYYLEQEQAAIENTFSGKAQVFSQDGMNRNEIEDVTYEELWDGKVKLTERMTDKEKYLFEKRYLAQKENNGRKLPELDPFEEKLYQLYLYNRERFGFMSEEAINSNKYLKAFRPHLVQKVKDKMADLKTEKEKEIESAVKAMFDKNKSITSDSIVQPKSIFSAMTSQKPPEPVLVQKKEGAGRKRPSMGTENGVETSPQYVPPVPKKPLQTVNSPVEKHAASSPITQNDSEDEMIHAAIRTPAKFLKQTNVMAVPDDELSPTYRKPPPNTICPNSILKTAKAVQSPSRGRIRFHETVPVPIDESFNEDSVLKIRGTLNFDEEDEDEDPVVITKSAEVANDSEDEVENAEEPVEMEKSYECQNDNDEEKQFEVYEDVLSEGKDENEAGKMDETFDIPQDIEERLDEIESADEEKEMEVDEDEKELEVDGEEKEMEMDEAEKELEAHGEEKSKEMLERSFEIQKDEDTEPVVEKSVEVADDCAPLEGSSEDVPSNVLTTCPIPHEVREEELCAHVQEPVEKSLEIQEETAKPEARRQETDEVGIEKTMEIQNEPEEPTKSLRRSTRPRTPSRCEGTNEIQQEAVTRKSTRTRTPSRCEGTNEIQQEAVTRKSTRTRTPSRCEGTNEIQQEAVTRKSTRTRTPSRCEGTNEIQQEAVTRKSTRTRTPSRSEKTPPLEIEPSPNNTGLSRRINSRTPRKTLKNDAEPNPSTGSRRNSVSTSSTSVKRVRQGSVSIEPEELLTPSKQKKSVSLSRQASEEPTTEGKTPKSSRRGRKNETVLDAIDEEKTPVPRTPRRAKVAATNNLGKINWRDMFATSIEKNVGADAAAIVKNSTWRSSSTRAKTPNKKNLEKIEKEVEEPRSAKRARSVPRNQKIMKNDDVDIMGTIDEKPESTTRARSVSRNEKKEKNEGVNVVEEPKSAKRGRSVPKEERVDLEEMDEEPKTPRRSSRRIAAP